MNTTQVQLKVSGDYALFTRPEMKVERVSYDTLTPSAARGILEAIYWKPQFRWVIDKIKVLNPIKFTNIRRNELGKTIPCRGGSGVEAAIKNPQIDPTLDINEERQQRASLLLKDVAYIITAHFEILDFHMTKGSPKFSEVELIKKHTEMFKRRAINGQVFHQPYLGCREFPARFEFIENDEEKPDPSLLGERDLSYMLHDLSFDQCPKTKIVKSTTPHFFRARMKNGTIEVPPLKACQAIS